MYNGLKKIYRKLVKRKHFLKFSKKTLLEFDKAMKEIGVTYWLAFGTLLGAIREKGFIKHDLDIDVGMFLKDHEKLDEQVLYMFGFKKTRTIVIDDGFYGREETFTKNGLNIDVFYFIEKDNKLKCHTFSGIEGLSWAKTEEILGGLVVRELSFPLTSFTNHTFLGTKFLIPEKYDEHLRANYGDYFIKDKNYSYKEANNQLIMQDKVGVRI